VAPRVGSRPTRIRLQGTRNRLPDHSQEGYGPSGEAFARSIWGMSAKTRGLRPSGKCQLRGAMQ